MNYKYLILLFLAVNIFFISNCANDKVDITAINAADCDSLTYSVDIEPIISVSCAYVGCHDVDQTAPGNYNNIADIIAHIENNSFKERVLDFMDMPPFGELTQDDVDALRCWLAIGYPE